MSTPKRTKLDWETDEHCQALAGQQADALIARLNLVAPIDPLEVAKSEHPLLVTGGRDLADRYDGKLKYNKEKKRFLLFYNTKYDLGLPTGRHHPRTRFSIGHELGHYFIEYHHDHLLNGGEPHGSSGEFKTATQMEREADAFASSLLLPTPLARRVLSNGELTLSKIDKVAGDFQTSLLCTTIRGVRLSDLPCAVAGLRKGRIAWMFPSKQLIAAKCYPGKKEIESPIAKARWAAFSDGDDERYEQDGMLHHWFQTFDRDEELHDVQVTESFLPVRIMATLVVLLTMDEGDVFDLNDEEEEEEEEERDRFGRSRA